jgi:hypothetical protein
MHIMKINSKVSDARRYSARFFYVGEIKESNQKNNAK